ncbi:MAG: DUF4160 domain-containing protein [Candidatus Gracilibacteria bacterium]|nr:DUF4160 domain-containing protein [Candidatus Gracilibacteria bacterium]
MNPKLSEFFGVSIYVYWNDHNPPHFHVIYKDFNCYISINELKILEGNLPPKIEKLVISWAELYNEELLEAWEDVQNMKTPKKIDPLISKK